MKLSYLIKATPFLSTLVLIIFLSISNQKEYTKIKILIWTTPSLTLGNYLAISIGTGFMLSYLITTNLGNTIQITQKQSLEFKDEDKFQESPGYKDAVENINQSYENTLIERDIKDPSPTINASFRIIKKTDRINEDYFNNNDSQYDDSIEFDSQYNDERYNNDNRNQNGSISTDWEDESFLKW